jgi:hypothetical protein
VALALLALGRTADASRPVQWLLENQEDDGTVGITAKERSPVWPTSLAIIAWQAMQLKAVGKEAKRLEMASSRARSALLRSTGHIWNEAPEQGGHDPSIVGWPWVDGTHSWCEPTAYALLALRASGDADHARARDAERLLLDRLLPDGGCNYGNTMVLGQMLRPHLFPTGLTMIALSGVPDESARVARSLDYLERNLNSQAAAASLAYATLGLAAQGRLRDGAHWLLERAAAQETVRGSAWRLSLVLLASLGEESPLIPRAYALHETQIDE